MPHCQTLLSILRQGGYRITPQREMIIETLAHSDHHLTAEEIYAQVHSRSQAVNIATVYRTLDLLTGAGLASRAVLGDGRVIFVMDWHGAHIHLVCRDCRQVINAEYALLQTLGAQIAAQYRFKADLEHVVFAGLCDQCQTSSQ